MAHKTATIGANRAQKATALTSELWSILFLSQINKLLAQRKQAPIPYTRTNIENIMRFVYVESGGNIAGFLRDYNPLNYNTGGSAHGVDWISAQHHGYIQFEPWYTSNTPSGVWLQKFPTMQSGINAVSEAFVRNNPTIITALRENRSAAGFGQALSQSEWSSGGYANSSVFPTLPTTNLVAGSETTTGTSPSIFQPIKGVADTALVNQALQELNSKGTLTDAWKDAFSKLSVPDQNATRAAIDKALAKSRNLSLGQEIAAGFGGVESGFEHAGKTIAAPFIDLSHFFALFTQAKTWIIVGAVVAIILGILILFVSSRPVKTVAGTATQIAHPIRSVK